MNTTAPLMPVASGDQVVISRPFPLPLATLMTLLRIRMGFPAETFTMAVQPLLKGHQAALGDQPTAHSVVLAIRALDIRRERILPPHAPPEVVGALAPRWTYAVVVASLLRGLRDDGQEDAWGLFETTVPPEVLNWLEQDRQVWDALRRSLVGSAGDANPISQIVETAAGSAPLSEREVRPEPADLMPQGLGGDFMRWVRSGLKDRSLVINTPEALVHRVPEGLLLLSPGIFRVFLLSNAEQSGGPREGLGMVADPLRHLQREVFKLGWHLTGEGGVTLHAYVWCHGPKLGVKVHGVLISPAQRLAEVLPAVNAALERQAPA
ncbi:MAG: helicase/relaxase domain-containing protein [Rubrivivax sp.]|nr:helicase/relaxase domain-containing protein [Rubrivivax sp.]